MSFLAVLSNTKQLNFENQSRVWRYDWGETFRAVCIVWRTSENCLFANFHQCNAFVPTPYNMKRQLERVSEVVKWKSESDENFENSGIYQ